VQGLKKGGIRWTRAYEEIPREETSEAFLYGTPRKKSVLKTGKRW